MEDFCGNPYIVGGQTAITRTANQVLVDFAGGVNLVSVDKLVFACPAISVGSNARLPMAQGRITATVTLAPAGMPLGAGGTALTAPANGQIPRYNAEPLPAEGLTVVVIAPGCTIQLNKSTFLNGDQIIAQSIVLSNSSTASRAAEYKFWFEAPGYIPISWARGGQDDSFVIAPGATLNYGPFMLFTLTSNLPRGAYRFTCRLVDPTAAKLFSEFSYPFTAQWKNTCPNPGPPRARSSWSSRGIISSSTLLIAHLSGCPQSLLNRNSDPILAILGERFGDR